MFRETSIVYVWAQEAHSANAGVMAIITHLKRRSSFDFERFPNKTHMVEFLVKTGCPPQSPAVYNAAFYSYKTFETRMVDPEAATKQLPGSRAEALRLKVPHYEGRECYKSGHGSKRRAHNNECVACAKERSHRYRKLANNPEDFVCEAAPADDAEVEMLQAALTKTRRTA